ncbi:leucine-rich repeat domain-containing protein [Polaribacter pectinis]|uniref:Leucine-rich repeat domain-containing protein n=1 Tax=Polaribacter pectinis TaxID=2738844 RepID=A0A7G9LAH5_9FLAO|nr:leucine-rich repeat domain-containing protein [Polaribacter pectinis]QNM85624.1 leucine-rich repeat domain-containing protein [Polaribacter pectinis]
MKKNLTILILLICFSCLKNNKDKVVKKNISLVTELDLCSNYDMKWSKPHYISQLFWRLNSTKQTLSLKDSLINKLKIVRLDISSSNLKSLPQELFLFENLEELDISNNKFEDTEQLILDLKKLPNLKLLAFRYSKLKKLPENIGILNNLEGISLDGNILRSAESIGELNNLKYLSFRRNKKLKELPSSINKLKCLQLLDVSGSGIERLRDELSECIQLKSILANASKISFITENIGDLFNLRNLNLGYNKLKNIPTTIGDLEFLEDLSLGSNEIEFLPESVSKLQNLDAIGLEYNRFKEFPKSVLKLNKLRLLKLHNNNIPEIPIEVAKLPFLSLLYVDHEVISDDNINQLKEKNKKLKVKRHDALRRAPGKIKRKI